MPSFSLSPSQRDHRHLHVSMHVCMHLVCTIIVPHPHVQHGFLQLHKYTSCVCDGLLDPLWGLVNDPRSRRAGCLIAVRQRGGILRCAASDLACTQPWCLHIVYIVYVCLSTTTVDVPTKNSHVPLASCGGCSHAWRWCVARQCGPDMLEHHFFMERLVPPKRVP